MSEISVESHRKSNTSEKLDVAQNSKMTPKTNSPPASFFLPLPQVQTVVRPQTGAYDGIQTGNRHQ